MTVTGPDVATDTLKADEPVTDRRPQGRHRRGPRFRHLPPAALVVVVVVVVPASGLAVLPPPIHVRVGDSIRVAAPGTTVGELGRTLGLRPRSGDLVDVEGVVLEKRRFRGTFVVNGDRASRSRRLVTGDRLGVRHGKDRREPLVQEVTRYPGGVVQNPQTHLGTTPGEQIVTSGKISGKVMSSVFRATGPSDTPPAVALTFDDGPWPEQTEAV
ncbi:MAG: hypothetical protein M3245_04345, partial [Actinomycetota bacterium]|nr:hypothetical protein [Actinomycetota bacterium]